MFIIKNSYISHCGKNLHQPTVKRENRKDKTELEEATGLTPTSEMIRNQIQKIEVPGKILLC